MTILVVRTADGPVYFSSQRTAPTSAAVEMVIDQLQRTEAAELFSLEPGESAKFAKKIKASRNPLETAISAGLITRANVRDR